MLALLTNSITSLGGMFGFQAGEIEMNIGGNKVKVGSINGLIKAIVTNSNTNVLATPQILALDNTEAIFSMGESVPVRNETITPTGQSFNYKPQEAKLKLKITPQINKVTRFIKLQIEQEIQDFAEEYKDQTGGLATSESSAATTVVVRDRDTVAMGGLMRDKDTVTESKVPLLGDIPILGWLFRNKSRDVVKVNMLMFMTPRILANYQKDAARNTRGILERRAEHLKDVTNNDDDAFEATVKELYDKSKKQEEGPLYDLEEGQRYLKENEKPGIGNSEASVPNYKEIVQKVQEARAATKENP